VLGRDLDRAKPLDPANLVHYLLQPFETQPDFYHYKKSQASWGIGLSPQTLFKRLVATWVYSGLDEAVLRAVGWLEIRSRQ
jgi:hypothetical protein